MKTEQKKYLKIFLLYFFLSLTIIVLVLKFGLKAAITVSEFIQGKQPETPSSINENIVPPPQFYPIEVATNSAGLSISGYSLPNMKVDLYLNDFSIKSFEVDSEGKFEGDISLSLGTNIIYGITTDKDNKKSQPSKNLTIFYGNSPPYLEITEPENNSTIKGRNNQITIKGKALNIGKVSVNDHLIVLSNEGIFEYPVKLQNGENKFTIVCFDPANNKTEINWTLNYQP